ncbi:MAG: hypothetical protein DBP02_13745 [gamma proteobacterium symbiont of Ctena orbiculata]|nr:MAG: hypothetical protein DBP02_13745 [gamma proteobacterium symbiont of Ctena orbiculata]
MMKSERKGKTLGTLGTILGLIALGVGLLHFTLGPIEEPVPVESFVAETTVKIKDAISAKLMGEEYKPTTVEKSLDIDEVLYQGVMIGGFIALALGAIGFSQNEEWRPSGVAFVLGGAAITLQLSIAFVGILILFLIIAAIISSLGLDISV